MWRRGAVYPAIEGGNSSPPIPAFGDSDMDTLAILILSLVIIAYEELQLVTDYQMRVSVHPQMPIYVIPTAEGFPPGLQLASPPPALEVDMRLGHGPDARATDFLSIGADFANLLERQSIAIEAFRGSPGDSAHDPRRQLAQRWFGGEPDHPLTGRTIA